MEILHNELRERALSDARWRQIQEDLNQSVSLCSHNFIDLIIIHWLTIYVFYHNQSDVSSSLPSGNNHLLEDSLPVDLTGEEVDALRGKYIRRLTAVLIHHIPAFWKIALSVFSGKFAKVFLYDDVQTHMWEPIIIFKQMYIKVKWKCGKDFISWGFSFCCFISFFLSLSWYYCCYLFVCWWDVMGMHFKLLHRKCLVVCYSCWFRILIFF